MKQSSLPGAPGNPASPGKQSHYAWAPASKAHPPPLREALTAEIACGCVDATADGALSYLAPVPGAATSMADSGRFINLPPFARFQGGLGARADRHGFSASF